MGEKIGVSFLENNLAKIFSTVLKICLLFDPAIPRLGICPKEVIKQACRNVGTRHSPQVYSSIKNKIKPVHVTHRRIWNGLRQMCSYC